MTYHIRPHTAEKEGIMENGNIRIIVDRSSNQAEEFAAYLKNRGFDAYIEPAGRHTQGKTVIETDEPIENFISELLHVAAGDIVVSKPFTKYLTNSEYNQEQSKEAICEQLSTREIDILRLVSKGYTNTEIGKALNISPHTVKGHLTHILTKLDLKNRQQAVAYLLNRKALAEETG